MDSVESSHIKNIVVLGASGFIGEHLIKSLADCKEMAVSVLVHHTKAKSQGNIKYIEGDMLSADSLDRLLMRGSTVINLAYLAQKNIEAVNNLADACVRNQVQRLIHCSTAVVVGIGGSQWVDEDTLCNPVSEYQRTKLELESRLLDVAKGQFEISILRPTAVFGAGGKNLIKLANELISGNTTFSYLKSCLFGRRSLNLVAVENVVAALIFLVDCEHANREVFIISDDDSEANNYRDVENHLLASFGRSYLIGRVTLPSFVLKYLLLLLGKVSINPTVKFSDKKLANLGFNKPKKFKAALDDFAEWFKTSRNVSHSETHK